MIIKKLVHTGNMRFKNWNRSKLSKEELYNRRKQWETKSEISRWEITLR